MESKNPFTPGLLTRLSEKPRKVALVRASRIGDFICATPAFRAMRRALPEAEITMITLPILQNLVLRSPSLDRFVAFPGFPGIAEQFFDARRAIHFFQAMQAEQFDLAVQVQGSGVYSNPFTLLLGARLTAGFVRPGDSAGRLDAALPYPENQHEVRRVLALTTFLGIPARGEEIEFPLWPGDHREAQRLLEEAKPPLIGLHPAARDATRRWSLNRFAAVGAALQKRYGGTVVILGESGERTTAEKVAQQVGRPCLNLAGRTSLASLGGVIAQLGVLVTNDSGPAHIAYALETPTVTVSGSEDPSTYRPLQNGSYRLLELESVTVPGVVQAAEELITLARQDRWIYLWG